MPSSRLTLRLAALIFSLSVAVYAAPIAVEGYAPDPGFDTLSTARNLALSGTTAIEDAKGKMLSSAHARSEGRTESVISPLTPFIYAALFKTFGAGPGMLVVPLYVSILLAALFNALAFLLIARQLSVRVGLAASLLMIFLPARVMGALFYGGYEFAMLFFMAALWLYLAPAPEPSKPDFRRLAGAGALFALAALSRNAFAISFVPFAGFEIVRHRSWKRSAALILPFLLLFGSTLTPWSWLGGPNGYVSGAKDESFSLLGEVFPDPYTAYYGREAFIKTLTSQPLDRSGAHFLQQWGYHVSPTDRFKAYADSIRFYAREGAGLRTGGWLVLLCAIAGAYWLFRNKKDLFWLFAAWFAVWFGSIVYFQTGNWDHFLEVAFPTAALAGAGVWQIAEWLRPRGIAPMKAGAALTLCLLAVLALASILRLRTGYRSSYGAAVAEATLKLEGNGAGTLAAGLHPNFAYGLAYFTDRDVVYFSQRTVEALIAEGKLKEAFDAYGVDQAAGFSASSSPEVRKATGAEPVEITSLPW